MYVVMYVFVKINLCLCSVDVFVNRLISVFKSVHLFLAYILNYLSANYSFCILFTCVVL